MNGFRSTGSNRSTCLGNLGGCNLKRFIVSVILLTLASSAQAENPIEAVLGIGGDTARARFYSVGIIVPTVDDSGDIYVGIDYQAYRRFVRLNGDGTLDSDFAIGVGRYSTVNSIAPVKDGSGDIYIGGGTYDTTGSNQIMRLKSDGTLDSDFTIDGRFKGIVYNIAPAVDGSGDIYVISSIFTGFLDYNSYQIERLNSDGKRDSGFAIGTGFNTWVKSIAPVADGSGDIYVGGNFTTYNDIASNKIVRVNRDGTLDSGFAIGEGFNSSVRSITLAADGSGDVYVGGDFSTYNGTASNGIVRLNNDGTLDSGFAIGTGFYRRINCIAPAIDGSGDVYAGGEFTTYNGNSSNRIVRLNSDGTLDSDFAIGGGFNSFVFSVAPAVDGSGDIYVGGNFTAYRSTPSYKFVRANRDGTLD